MSKVQVRTVCSDCIASVKHSEYRHTLDIGFTTGRKYRYYDVPRVAAEQLLDAKSAGKVFNSSIKGRFRFVSMDGGQK